SAPRRLRDSSSASAFPPCASAPLGAGSASSWCPRTTTSRSRATVAWRSTSASAAPAHAHERHVVGLFGPRSKASHVLAYGGEHGRRLARAARRQRCQQPLRTVELVARVHRLGDAVAHRT